MSAADHTLIALCAEFDACEREVVSIYDAEPDNDRAEATVALVMQRQFELSGQIAENSAHTPDGIIAIQLRSVCDPVMVEHTTGSDTSHHHKDGGDGADAGGVPAEWSACARLRPQYERPSVPRCRRSAAIQATKVPTQAAGELSAAPSQAQPSGPCGGEVMSARRKLTPEQLYAQAEERELLGLTEDGRLILWDTDRVMPVSQFRYRRDKRGKRWIDEGYFVIDWGGSEIVAHLGNFPSGNVSVLLMCQSGGPFALSRRQIRPALRYKVIPDPVRQRERLDRLQLCRAHRRCPGHPRPATRQSMPNAGCSGRRRWCQHH